MRRDVLVADGVELDIDVGLMQIDGREIELTAIETTLAHALLARAGGVVTQAELFAAIWPGDDVTACKNRLYTHVFALRRKFEATTSRFAIRTARCGYRLAAW